MDAIIRCHTLSEDELRRVFDLHTARMNKLLDEKSYFSGLQVRTTQAYVDNIISGSRSIEYGARAIIPAIKAM
jgi:ATP-dependent Clp protease ATP-binding subunit ClpA